MRYAFDSSVDYHVIQIGANILSEVNPTSYPVRITFDDGSARGAWEFQGVTDLPYLSYVFNGVLRTQLPNPGPRLLGGRRHFTLINTRTAVHWDDHRSYWFRKCIYGPGSRRVESV